MQKPNTASAGTRGIVGTNNRGGCRDEFLKAGGTFAEVKQQPPKIVQRILKRGGEAKPRASSGSDGVLQVAK